MTLARAELSMTHYCIVLLLTLNQALESSASATINPINQLINQHFKTPRHNPTSTHQLLYQPLKILSPSPTMQHTTPSSSC